MSALDVTDTSFESEVLVSSEARPVVVDLWAPWCGPCRTLGPILEKVVDESKDAVLLAKVNIDENPRVAATFQVQSIPAVFALYRRQIVDRFIGALPEQQVRDFVAGVLARAEPSKAERLVAQGDEASLRAALEIEPGNAAAITALAALLVKTATPEARAEALSLLERIPENAETRRLAALARTEAEAVAPAALEQRLDSLLARVPGDEEARQEILDLLETMDEGDPRRTEYRRALSAKLF